MARTSASNHQGGTTRPPRKVSQSLSSSTSTSSIVAKSGFISVQGTWTGTINVEVDPDSVGTWSNMTDTAGTVVAITANCNIAFDNGCAIKTRVKFTRTTGTAVIVLAGG
jgi:hypothetical protein